MQYKIFILPLIVAALLACNPEKNIDAKKNAAINNVAKKNAYMQDLLKMIRDSERIVVTEHSFQYDLWDAKTNKSLVPQQITYGTKELDSGQKLQFSSIVNKLDGNPQDAFPACIFEPHHTIQFFGKAKLLSTMDICFACGQVKWDGSTKTPPESLYEGLATFIKQVGFEPKRDWPLLAQQQGK